jgi:hypothetical protein
MSHTTTPKPTHIGLARTWPPKPSWSSPLTMNIAPFADVPHRNLAFWIEIAAAALGSFTLVPIVLD